MASIVTLAFVQTLPAGGSTEVVLALLVWIPAIAGMVTLTVARRVLIASERAASTDPLTGLLNHRAFHEQLDRELSRAARRGDQATLLMIDIDNFKSINDLGGHRAGDRVLRDIADTIRNAIRDVDAVGRIGGDELAVIAPATGARAATALARRLVQVVHSVHLGELDPSATLTVSIGCSVYPDLATTRTELIEAADAALYLAKQRGRDGCALSAPTADEPDAPEIQLDRVHAELAASRADFRALFDHAMEALLITDGTTILRVNEAAVRMAGVARERLVGHQLTEFARTGDESFARKMRAAVESGRGVGETSLVTSDRRDAIIVEFASARFSPGRYILEIRDVTERARTQAALAASEATLRAVFEHAADSMFVLDDDGVVLDANRAACQLAERSRPELIGTRVASLVASEDAAAIDHSLAGLRADGVRLTTFEAVDSGGRPRRLESVAVADVVPGRNLAVVRDVTVRDTVGIDREVVRLSAPAGAR